MQATHDLEERSLTTRGALRTQDARPGICFLLCSYRRVVTGQLERVGRSALASTLSLTSMGLDGEGDTFGLLS